MTKIHSSDIRSLLQKMNLEKISYDDNLLFSMINKRSSSIVKRILFLSILEFSISLSVTIYSSIKRYSIPFFNNEENTVLFYLDILYYIVFIFFLFKFFLHFKSIDNNTNVYKLSDSILKTRKSVYNFIIANLILFNINCIFFSYFCINNIYIKGMTNINNINFNFLIFIFCFIVLILLLIFSLFIWFVYRFFYLKLVDKLVLNIKELKKTNI